jgi:hypothetical protein
MPATTCIFLPRNENNGELITFMMSSQDVNIIGLIRLAGRWKTTLSMYLPSGSGQYYSGVKNSPTFSWVIIV